MYAALVAALLIRPCKASFLFVATATLFQIACSHIGGSSYFMLAAACDFTVAGIVSRSEINRKSLNIVLISLISLLLNLCGHLMWWFFQPLDWYVSAFQWLYLLAIGVILCKDDEDVRCVAFHFDNATHYPDVVSGR